jgi:siroheme synthase-like protein
VADPIDDGYPVVVRLSGRPVLVVGGGLIALRKAQGLHAAGARLTVVSPEVVPGFAGLDGITVHRRGYRSDDLAGHLLVVAATNDPAVQQQVFDDGEAAGVLVNSVDDPDRCSFILPAIVRRGPVIVAVSTQGRSPALASQLRDRLAGAIPADIERIADEAAARRAEIHASGRSTEDEPWPDLLPPA